MNIDYSRIPAGVMETLRAWADEARPLGAGSFCEAVLSNNLIETFKRGSEESLKALPHIVGWIYNEADGSINENTQ